MIMTLIARRGEATDTQLEVERLSFNALDAYRHRRFTEALAMFQELEALEPGLLSTRIMIERVTALQLSGVDANWNGVTEMATK